MRIGKDFGTIRKKRYERQEKKYILLVMESCYQQLAIRLLKKGFFNIENDL